jgi:hypothetical protein
MLSISLTALASYTIGRMNRITSSAYMLHWYLISYGFILLSTPSLDAFWNMRWRMSIAMMKSNRDKESPCLTPRKCLIGGP